MLTKPILLSLPSFDATKKQIFTFSIGAGGSQVVANKLTVRRQDNNEIVYESKESTFKYEHILPAGSLENGQYYNAVVTVFDNKGNESAPSSPIQFRCYTTPTIKFTNFPETATINNSSYSFAFQYEQIEGERIDSYVVNLYDIGQNLISSSGTVYVQNGVPPYRASYLFTGLVDDNAYYVEVVGLTINGASVKTDRLRFNVDYEQPDLFTLLELENNCEGGYITVASNIILIDAETQPDPPVFIGDKEIDLSGEGSYVKWPQGYSINGDFLTRAWFRKPKDYAEILRYSSADGKMIQVVFMKGYENETATQEKAYVQVYVKSIEGMEYYIFSNYITPLADTEYYNLHLRRIDNVYQVELIQNKEVL